MQGDRDRPIVPGIIIEQFDPGRHERSGFSCGTDRLDNFLRFSARKQQKDDFTRVFVAVAEGSPKVLGYYALNAHAIATGDLGADRPRHTPSTGSIPALYLSMIAVDRSQQGKGLGSDLAVDALGRARTART
jgi:ribosomal protein S18 acetylase RimI-like enzyme